MARQRTHDRRKTRTREHILGDLAVNHVERQVLHAGFTYESIYSDYGYDASIFVYNERGEPEEGILFAQVKGTEETEKVHNGQAVSYRIERMDLRRWLVESQPVFLCVYDAREDQAYWLYVQNYFERQQDFNLFALGEKVTVHLPTSQILTRDSVLLFRDYLRSVIRQQTVRVRHV